MRVLFDKNVPYQIRAFLRNHEVRTVGEQQWNRLANGELLKAAEAERFDVVVTADQNIPYQQNLKDREIGIVILGTNQLSLLEADPSRFVRAVNSAGKGAYEFVEYKIPPKQKPGGRESS